MDATVLEYMTEHYDAVIIESFGVGGLPNYETGGYYPVIEKWISLGKVVIMTTQVTNEGSNMSVYEVGRNIKNAFGLSGGNRYKAYVDSGADERQGEGKGTVLPHDQPGYFMERIICTLTR